jgi:tetratricopeptide (TPR) repeat protein
MPTVSRIENLLERAMLQMQGGSAEALVFAEEARELAQELSNPVLEARALCLEAQALFLERRAEDALLLLSLMSDVEAPVGVGVMAGMALGLEARIRFAAADLEGAISCWERCRALPDGAISIEDRILALVGLGQILQWAARAEFALKLHREAEMLAQAIGDAHLLNITRIQIAHDLAALAEYESAQMLLQEIQPQIELEGNYTFEAEVYELAGEVWLGRGQIDKANNRLTVALKIYRLLGNLWGQADCLLNQARCHLARAQTDDALDMLAEVRDITATFPAPGIRCALFLAMAEALAQRGDLVSARLAEQEYENLCADLARVASLIRENA